jgi:hypothetical protein
MSRIRIAVAVTDAAIERMQEVVHACRALGFRADSTLPGVGVFTGSIDTGTLGALRKIPGVAAVEVEHEIRIHQHRSH